MKPEFELRLATKVAHLYWVEQMRQVDIASRLNLSQAGVSRLLRRAQKEGIVAISIKPPEGTYHLLEEELCAKYGLSEVVVAACPDNSENAILSSIGEAAAQYLESTLRESDRVGISSWSSALVALSEHLPKSGSLKAERVVQLMGGMSHDRAEHLAENLTLQLANRLRARPGFMHVAGITSSPEARKVICEEPYVRETMALFDELSIALVGIGTLEPSRFLARSGNTFSKEELSDLASWGAVGDVCLRFFDDTGDLVTHSLNDRVVAISPDSLKSIPRVVGLAGGQQKVPSIRAAALGGWIQVLITDSFTAEALLDTEG
ncbi:sugar-binding transcriptional regulator [Halomonas elongata]|uniref:LsrR family transcription regulator n=1 Tax=Halomonas elongata (strain ATCC 33173 / DSM 2581 / NBRC 15536 / NCIMB 2198 / 1H9) TaxID=768066 RepID=E1V9W7_HALED|nr:sugar-binding transcriptional regulator [Halomonas elongata]MBW5801953.1 sugar-binding transcriptional regulator [Halomonas elongata]WBF17595.1 sugar-binding transcriptional regulator [Halomonas elongata]WPU46434.1 sugar-binding transcriptional regulator [Halomonas elongata DSM 2581]WVI71226.1 sugar-binding transcriptional regulator [Halomonas elongata]CBV43855.1 LsrR family transcription regulator [Halomonas elongata DSM 2581]